MSMELANLLSTLQKNALFDVRLEYFRQTHSTELLRLVAVSTVELNDCDRADPTISDYGIAVFVRQILSSQELSRMLEDIAQNKLVDAELSGISCPVTCMWPLTETHFSYNRNHGRANHGLYRSDRPYDSYCLQNDVPYESTYNPSPINARGERYFESLKEAEAYYLYDRFVWLESQSRSSLEIVIEESRGWFEEIIVGRSSLRFVLGGSNLDDCEVKILGRNPGLSAVYSVANVLQNGISIRHLPQNLVIVLTLGDEVLDYRRVAEHSTLFLGSDGVRFEYDEPNEIQELIVWRGESLTLEYKSQWSNSVLNTMAAFANTEGGSILFGIKDDDDGISIVGVQDVDELKRQITDFAERTSGHFSYQFQTFVVDSHTVVRLIVDQASEKPIAVTSGGGEHKFYVRRDGSTRRIRREDILNLIAQQTATQSNYSSGGRVTY